VPSHVPIFLAFDNVVPDHISRAMLIGR
jgi:hypothetical protein